MLRAYTVDKSSAFARKTVTSIGLWMNGSLPHEVRSPCNAGKFKADVIKFVTNL